MATRPALTPKPGNRKPSWLYDDLAWKIIFPNPAVLLILRYLAKCANDSGRCYVAYSTIRAICGKLSTSTVYESLQVLYDLRIVTLVKQGFGNQHSKDNVASTYQLHLAAMRKVIDAQDIFSSVDNGERLLSGDKLTAQVKLLPSLSDMTKMFATIAAQPATIAKPSACIAERPATIAERYLTLYLQPSTEQPPVRDPLQSPPMVNPPTQEIAPVGTGVPQLGGNPQYMPPLPSLSDAGRITPVPLSSVRQPSRTEPPRGRTENYITFDDGWTSDKPQKFPTNLLVPDEPC